MHIEDGEERVYEKEAIRSNWNVSTLKRQFNSSLYEILALTKEPPSIERYARWCERSANLLMVSLLLDCRDIRSLI